MDAALDSRDTLKFKTGIGRFFYACEVPYGLAIVRISLPLVLLSVVLPRWMHTRELFSSDGAAAPIALNYGIPQFLPEVSGTVAVALMTTLAICLVTSSIGWCTRVSLIASFALFTYLNMLDSLSTMTKYSVIASHCLFILCLSNCGAIWSVDNWLHCNRGRHRRQNDAADSGWPTVPVWPQRLMQILIGAIYFGSAFTKLHTSGFLTSDQLRSWMMTDVNNANPIGEYLSLHPSMLVAMSHIAITWEMLFLFLCWKGWSRIFMLAMGVMFHLATTPLLGLYIFPAVMVAVYFCFLSENDVRIVQKQWALLQQRLGWPRMHFKILDRLSTWPSSVKTLQKPTYPSALVFGLFVAIGIVLGIELEHRLDPYGIRRPDGPYALKEMDPARARELLRPSTAIRPQDKILALEIGTKLFGGVLIDRKDKFRQGECLLAQCTLVPPHEDMWVECNLHDHNDRIIDRVGQIAPRSMIRCNFVYTLTEALTPGEYFLVLKTAGIELEKKTITLLPRLQAPVAN